MGKEFHVEMYLKKSMKIVEICHPFISSPLNYICNKILFWGVFPVRIKYTVIKPLHKNGDRCEVSNYRPVSLSTSFSKIFEMVMQTRILKHLIQKKRQLELWKDVGKEFHVEIYLKNYIFCLSHHNICYLY